MSSSLGGHTIHVMSALGSTGRFLVEFAEGDGGGQCSSGSSVEVLFTVIPNGQNCITRTREPLENGELLYRTT